MKKNIGITDRIIRFALIDLLLGFSLMGVELPLFLANSCFIVSLILALTIIFAYSPIYHIVGFTTIELVEESTK